MKQFKKSIILSIVSTLLACTGSAVEKIEILALDVISYEEFTQKEPHALSVLKDALFEKGIVGIKGVPGYKEKAIEFIESARAFSALPENVKEAYAPNFDLGEIFLGYEKGKEKFKRPDGTWVVDDLKTSYYAFVPNSPLNKWPSEVDLKNPFENLGSLMSEIGVAVMEEIGLIGESTGVSLGSNPDIGRMLYYRKNISSEADNPFWCGAHFDHGIFTALLPAYYFIDGEAVSEPIEAGLFVKPTSENCFKKVVSDDPDVMLFQVGEFGQLITNDAIKATEHRVHKAKSSTERYTMALFFTLPMETVIHSFSELTEDARYGGNGPGSPCSYLHWHEESFNRYIVKEEEKAQDIN
ncbi:MAG: hypothetical protein P4L16_02150 [Chlamydiales bacterium]|nr:hypothetical protein [Chlamydiales bacterium]